ncbi:MAG: mevalonate kinase [Methanosarcinales archaeon]|nr:mevalonate kinase [Methanosarcinales archaeon]
MTSASAPGKVILFGEHAVVSGSPALGSAIDLRARVQVEKISRGLEIDIKNLGLTVTGFSIDPHSGSILSLGSSDEALKASRYVRAIVQELELDRVRITVDSELPVGAGLGSSAAIVVAALGALNCHLGNDLSREEIAKEAFRIEKMVQQGLGSPMDTALSAFGGYRLVSQGTEPVDLPPLDLVVGFTGISHDTRKEVAKVQSLKGRYPEVLESIFKAIGAVTFRAMDCIKAEDMPELGTLMNINQGLLEAIGVNTRELSELIYAARGSGRALGAKLTGAGGGGCMIALPAPGGQRDILTALSQAKGQGFQVATGGQGLMIESP